METQSVSGQQGGILIGDGNRLWIHWADGRPRWDHVKETDADEKTRFSSYMTKPAPQGKHSIWHEALFLGGGMSLPILEASIFHGYTDSIDEHLDAVRGLGTEAIAGEQCDKIEVSLLGHQRIWLLWLSKRDHLPRRLKEVVRIGYDNIAHEEWSSVTTDDDVPDSMFAWKPPAEWTQWRLPDAENGLRKPGSKAPDFEMASVDGKRIRLSDFRGSPVWLCFWRIGCPPCRVQTPSLQELYAKHKDDGIVVIGVNVWDDRAFWVSFNPEPQATAALTHRLRRKRSASAALG